MPRNEKGSRRERELVNRLDELGWAVMRAPSSGAATARNLPDVLAGDDGYSVAIEAKSSSGKPIYIDGAEIDALLDFAFAFGAHPLVGVRFDHEPWLFEHPKRLYVTDGGNYRVKKEYAKSQFVEIDVLRGQ